VSEKERLAKKKQKELAQKIEAREKEAKRKFREKIEEKVNEFIKDGDGKTYKFPAMDKYQRYVRVYHLPIIIIESKVTNNNSEGP
jgi:hypothetical protein